MPKEDAEKVLNSIELGPETYKKYLTLLDTYVEVEGQNKNLKEENEKLKKQIEELLEENKS